MMRSISFLGALILAASFCPSVCYTITARPSRGYRRRAARHLLNQELIQREYLSQTSLCSTRVLFKNGAEDEEVPVDFASDQRRPQWEPESGADTAGVSLTDLIVYTRVLFKNGAEDEEVPLPRGSPVDFASDQRRPQWEVLRQLPLSSSGFVKMAVQLEENETMLVLGRIGMVAFSLLVATEAITGQSIVEFLR
eukprot:CAMPEP_0194345612 /NCGR_PEP_ID=MMETSP0171-20130528/104957_1 /TAXON_ID=218684 /ORGANISM="Corethron pennatum, Strain L29A3" /LENGTH=194 /DNA_ID=CAMNT_0039112625 /DNA_START=135 /DNA_END=720 /DNA_ORIENTATION=-